MNKFNAGNKRNYDFSKVPSNYMSRTRLYRPGSHFTTFSTDYLYPMFLDEVLPGDTMRLDVSSFIRMTTSVVPFMSNMYLDWQFFFVPNRLVWSHWQNFCGEQDNPDDSVDFTVPYLESPEGGVSSKSLYDYFGIPVGKAFGAHDVQSLPFRCYNLIWNQWYRDENLQDSVTVPTGDGPDSASTFTLLKRGKRKDYFTSSLPSPQKGPSVTIPLSSDAPVVGNGLSLGLGDGALGGYGLGYGSGGLTVGSAWFGQDKNPDLTIAAGSKPTSLSGHYAVLGVTGDKANSGLIAKTSDLSLISINELRQAFQMQKFFERMARGGTRYIEILKSMFGVNSPDARLQRPELLTSFTIPLQLVQIAQTSPSADGSTPQGNLTANGVFSGNRFAFSKSFVEHGFIIGLVSVRSDLLYQQGLHRMWSRSTLYDYYWPPFAHLGEQPVLNKEIYLQNSSVVDESSKKVNDLVFGYQERWSEYKYGQNRVSAELRSDYAQSLDVWHLGQNFANLPTLSPTFIEENVPIDRVVAVSTSDAQPFLGQFSFDVVSVRPLPLYDIPGLVDHF